MLPMISPISDHLKASLGASNYVGKVQQSQSFPWNLLVSRKHQSDKRWTLLHMYAGTHTYSKNPQAYKVFVFFG